jgi:MYXO-CTERM domain-containing protein
MTIAKKALVVALIAGAASAASAQTIVAPSTAETGGLSTPVRALPRQYAEYINPSQLTALSSPVFITGLRARLAAAPQVGVALGGTWPAAPISLANFQVQMSEGSATLNTAGEIPTLGSYTSFQGGTVTTTYSGNLPIAAGTFALNSDNIANGTNPFATLVNFTTPYTYNPGTSLLLYIRHNGFGGTDNVFFANTNFANGIADAVSTLDNTSANATGFSSPIIWEFTYTPVPAPGAAALLGLGGLVATRRRRTA